MKKVAIYARVSTSDQSAESQLMELRSYCARRDFAIHREYVDQVTGIVQKRRQSQGGEYKRLMSDARQKHFDVVLVWKFDRFARSLKDLIEGLQLFQELGIAFISATQDIDTTTSMGRFFFQVVGAFAEMEREIIVERVRAGVANARRKGKVLGRPRSSSTAEEQRILDLHERGKSHRQIAQEIARSPSGVWLVLQRYGVLKQDRLALSSEARQGDVLSVRAKGE
jgi:DNA invertase Pin-like site-specific DNA recombinase